MFVHRNLWRWVEGGGHSKYCVIDSFCSQTFMGAKCGCRYVGGLTLIYLKGLCQLHRVSSNWGLVMNDQLGGKKSEGNQTEPV